MNNTKKNLRTTVTEAAIQLQAVRGVNAISEAAAGAKIIEDVAKQFANARHANQVAGRVFESLQATTANVDAALKGLPQRFATTASLGQPHAPGDVVVKLGQKTMATAQAKLSDSSTALVRRISDKAYDGMQKVVPTDKLDSVRKIASRLAADGRRPDLSLSDTAQRVSDRVTFKGASAKPVSVAEAQSAALQPQAAGKAIETSASKAVYGSAAAVGGVMSAAMVAMQGGSTKDVLQATANGAARGLAQQAATVGVEKVGTVALSQISSKAAASFSRAGAAGAIAGAGIGVASDLYDLANGKISGRECAQKAAKHGVRAGTTWAGAEAGAMIGAVAGPVGVAVGGIVGGILGSLVPDLF